MTVENDSANLEKFYARVCRVHTTGIEDVSFVTSVFGLTRETHGLIPHDAKLAAAAALPWHVVQFKTHGTTQTLRIDISRALFFYESYYDTLMDEGDKHLRFVMLTPTWWVVTMEFADMYDPKDSLLADHHENVFGVMDSLCNPLNALALHWRREQPVPIPPVVSMMNLHITNTLARNISKLNEALLEQPFTKAWFTVFRALRLLKSFPQMFNVDIATVQKATALADSSVHATDTFVPTTPLMPTRRLTHTKNAGTHWRHAASYSWMSTDRMHPPPPGSTREHGACAFTTVPPTDYVYLQAEERKRNAASADNSMVLDVNLDTLDEANIWVQPLRQLHLLCMQEG